MAQSWDWGRGVVGTEKDGAKKVVHTKPHTDLLYVLPRAARWALTLRSAVATG